MNKKSFLYLIFITLLTSACLTTSSLVRTLEQNPNMTPYEADQKFGKPAEEYPTPDRTIVCKIYTPAFTDYKDRTVVLFANNKLFRYGRFSKFFVIDDPRLYRRGTPAGLEKQKTNSIQYNQPQIIGRQSTTNCYTDSQGNIHCTTNQH